MINFIAEILGALIRLIYNIFGENYGLSIIIFTILTKVLMFPVTYKQEKAMQEMGKVAPLEKEIREKYKGVTPLTPIIMQIKKKWRKSLLKCIVSTK